MKAGRGVMSFRGARKGLGSWLAVGQRPPPVFPPLLPPDIPSSGGSVALVPSEK